MQSGRYQNASEGLRHIEQRERLEAAKLQALQQAAEKGWADITAERYVDIFEDHIENFMSELGQQAANRVKLVG